MKPVSQISFAFDIGHASIGWAVILQDGTFALPCVAGCGTVVFPAGSCENFQRAGFRRQRRHVAGTRNRIKRLEKLLLHLGVFTEADIEHSRKEPHPFPWLLAARILGGHRQTLTWQELWAVLRWYAHNRGYDGNALWTDGPEPDDQEDTKKVTKARDLMEAHRTATMAETVCGVLGVNPAATVNPAMGVYFKGEDAAFPRSVVRAEVKRILEAHIGQLPCVDAALIQAFVDDWSLVTRIDAPIRLPGRYRGGLLFGQMVPRFDNRIIPTCRITGEKTPDRHCKEFYRYRWGMLLANLRQQGPTDDGPVKLTARQRRGLNAIMECEGHLTAAGLKKAMRDLGITPSNLETMFLTSEMEKALTLDPVKQELGGKTLKDIWAAIPEAYRRIFANQLWREKPVTLHKWRERLDRDGVDLNDFDAAVLARTNPEKKTKSTPKSVDAVLDEPLKLRHRASGRAPYARAKMAEAWEAIFDDQRPDPKDKGGCLEETPEVLMRQKMEDIDQSTNNHLVRHRLLIFKRLFDDLVSEYAGGDPAQVSQVAIEVVRDLVEFSGKSSKEIAQLIGMKMGDFNAAVKAIEKHEADTGETVPISAGLIKKVRIARDLNWTCPYTGRHYGMQEIITGAVDREHIIPRSLRPSDSMDSLVLTFTDINRRKGKRLAWQFIEDEGGNGDLFTPQQFEAHVKSLQPKSDPRNREDRTFIDDNLRRWKRKQHLLLPAYEPRKPKKAEADEEDDSGFTGRDLTQTSFLNKLAARQVLKAVQERVGEEAESPLQPHHIVHLSGSVTGAVRRSWKLLDALHQAVPETTNKTKHAIRKITHLHHALDAVNIGLAAALFPRNGRLWQLMSLRQIRRPADQAEFKRLARQPIYFSQDGKWDIAALPDEIKQQIADRLSEKRVVMHLPRTMRGLRAQQNTWRVLGPDPQDPERSLAITQATRGEDKKRHRKHESEKRSLLLGSSPKRGSGKLANLQGAIIIDGNYGVALDPQPFVIPHFDVWHTIQRLTAENGGKPPRIIRNGYSIEIKTGKYQGRWRVHSIKDARVGIMLDLAHHDVLRVANKSLTSKVNVKLSSLLKAGLEIETLSYTGTPRS